MKTEEIRNLESVPSPALLVFPGRVGANIQRMIDTVDGQVARLRPHVKTHKMAEVVRMQVDAGITRFKCATISEAEMTAESGGRDILLAHQPVGPNIRRYLHLQACFPMVSFNTIVDSPQIVAKLEETGRHARLYVDIDCGMHRTGIEPGVAALKLCRMIAKSSTLEFAGLHVYDGHIHDEDPEERAESHARSIETWAEMLETLEKEGPKPPEIVAGGSPTFALSAGREGWQCSPGTTLFWDAGYDTLHSDLGFEVAAMLLTRVISLPGEGRICLDLGHKSVAAENPLEKRVQFPALPEARAVLHSEEHLVLEIPGNHGLSPGDEVLGIPWHICPTVALHDKAHVVQDGEVTGESWQIQARNRYLTI